jgi:SAM-dependent methyltransferase
VTALDRWGDELRAMAIPEAILDAAPESPFAFPTELFRRRAERSAAAEPTPTTMAALDALPADGTVLDVGCGGGATSLPLAARAASITGVDASGPMLETFAQQVGRAGAAARTVEGSWPEVAAKTPEADVVVGGHVLYNVQDLEPFVRALDTHALRRSVLELTGDHPLAWMSDLWERFHGWRRPAGPTSAVAEAALRELGLAPTRADRGADDPGGFARRGDAVALIRRRLCLPADRDDEIAEALGDRLRRVGDAWDVGPPERAVVTLWWDSSR